MLEVVPRFRYILRISGCPATDFPQAASALLCKAPMLVMPFKVDEGVVHSVVLMTLSARAERITDGETVGAWDPHTLGVDESSVAEEQCRGAAAAWTSHSNASGGNRAHHHQRSPQQKPHPSPDFESRGPRGGSWTSTFTRSSG